MISAPVAELNQWLAEGRHDSAYLDSRALEFLGIFVLRNALSLPSTEKYQKHYQTGCASGQLRAVEHHQTAVSIPLDNPLHGIAHEPEVQTILSNFFGGNVGSDRIRLVRKDAQNSNVVFVHHDIGYLRGHFDKYALFFALSPCNASNGGLTLYPGTHHFGYLGDVGEIRNVLPDAYPVITPDLQPGDLLIMHMGTWHGSADNASKTERVYLEITVQDADDPSTLTVLCGQRTSPWQLDLGTDDLFTGSRQQRIRQLYQTIRELEARLPAQ
jgi:hypothetical protein